MTVGAFEQNVNYIYFRGSNPQTDGHEHAN